MYAYTKVPLRGTCPCDEDRQSMRIIAINQLNHLVRCIVLMRHVSAQMQVTIIRLIPHETKIIMYIALCYFTRLYI
jgi:hypothetical protein